MPIRPSDLGDPVVTFVTSFGIVEVQLLPQRAPVTVANFLSYTSVGFYDGAVFHRLFRPTASNPAIVAQAGLLAADGAGGYNILDPLSAPIQLESQNGLSNTLGTLGMARTSVPDSAAAQFYFNTADNSAGFDFKGPENPGFAVFGKTQQGLEVLAAISQAPTRTVNAGDLGVLADFPRQDIVIQTVRSTQFFDGRRKDYTISPTTTDLLVTPIKGGAAVSVSNIDRLQFKDVSLGINEVLTGTLATNRVLAVAGEDNLRIVSVGSADEMFSAGRNNVILDGRGGNDTLTGSAGVDSFAFTAPLDAKSNVDTVFDFDPVKDTLQLGREVFSAYAAAGPLPAADLVASARPKAAAANQRLLYNTRTGDLAYDADGNGKASKPVVFAKLVGIPALTAADFLIIDPAN